MRAFIAAIALAALPAAALESTPAPTFVKDVAPIVFNQCAACHHPGEVAPFSLTSYADVKKRAKQIARVTPPPQMPPGKAEPGFGDFQNERPLTDAQTALTRAWPEAGAPEGDPAQTPPLPKFNDGGWQMG